MSSAVQKDNKLIDSGTFVAPRAILEMYQRMSFRAFKVWACILTDIAEKTLALTSRTFL